MRKIYGQSQATTCVFCDKLATSKNKQGFATCKEHVNDTKPDKKCICGEWLDVKESKWGAFYLCSKCGPISLSKAEEMEAQQFEINNNKNSGFKLNKKFRDEKEKQEKEQKLKEQPIYEDKVYTMTELLQRWNSEK